MRETHYFYTPDITTGTLPPDEATHCTLVLRLTAGSNIIITDGKGKIYQAIITDTANKRCKFKVTDIADWEKEWRGHIHIAMSPTKNINRTEWLVEKAIEIGVDEITFLSCTNSEHKGKINLQRMDKIATEAMKQSHKALKTKINGLTPLIPLLKSATEQQKFIAHCFDQADITNANTDLNEKSSEKDQKTSHHIPILSDINEETSKIFQTTSNIILGKPYLPDEDNASSDTLVLVGPEGDFTIDEVRKALSLGFRPVHLGRSRLRTETAALVAAHLIHIKHST